MGFGNRPLRPHSIDGEGGTLAYAGYCWSRRSDDSPILSRAVFDEDDIEQMLDNDEENPSYWSRTGAIRPAS